MLDDIRPPKFKKRPEPTPKSLPTTEPPEAVIELDEAGRQEPDSAAPAKQRKLLAAPHKHFIRFWKWWLSLGRNQRFAVIAGLLLLFGIAAILWFRFIQPASNPSISITKHPRPKPPSTVASPLTGLQVTPAQAARPVTAVMIENSWDARPQSGLQAAGVVYEAVAEGGVTRFMALFQEARPQYIGPVRSLRTYYIDFAEPFQASIVHVGGAPDALARVRDGHYRDLDEFFNAGYYWRINSRAAPHNVYTSFDKLDALNKSKGYKHSVFTPWPRKAEAKLKQATAANINIHISGPDYYVHYGYDPKTNTYPRSEAGSRHQEIVNPSGKLVNLGPKVVIALVMPESNGALDSSGAYYSNYQDIGIGRAYVFQDGGATKGLWKKTSASARLQFLTSDGQPIKLNPGQVWITLVTAQSQVSYAAR